MLIDVDPSYGYVILVISSTWFLLNWMGMRVLEARRIYEVRVSISSYLPCYVLDFHLPALFESVTPDAAQSFCNKRTFGVLFGEHCSSRNHGGNFHATWWLWLCGFSFHCIHFHADVEGFQSWRGTEEIWSQGNTIWFCYHLFYMTQVLSQHSISRMYTCINLKTRTCWRCWKKVWAIKIKTSAVWL